VANTDGGKGRQTRPISLPQLTDFVADSLESSRDYEAIAFAGRDFTGHDASDSRFLDCLLERCCLEGASLRRARIIGCVLADVYGAGVDFADSTWRDCEVTGGRLGAMTMPGATWVGIRVRGARFGYANLAGARLDDVVFENCEIGAVDASSARLRSVAFVDCTVEELNVSEAGLSKVDLSGARLGKLFGVESLRGAIVGHQQLLDLAPLLAAQLGLEVRPG
jgi:uncharacterized protein YjbI with pentapeptide repeats